MRCTCRGFILCLLAIFAAGPLTASAQSSSAAETVKTTVEKVKAAVASGKNTMNPEQLDAKLKEIITPAFDFREMAKRSLGANWNTATPVQQDEYVDLFSDLLARNYLKKIRENVESGKFSVTGELGTPENPTIKTHFVSADNETVSIDYRLYKKDGQWKAYDVVIENIGLVSNYRSEFAGIIRKEKMEGLLKRLREKQVGSAPGTS